MAHVSKNKSKPEGVGAEMKAAADGVSGIMLKLDIMEGKVAQHAKEFSEYGEGTAVTLRLVGSYYGTARTVVADSAFSSVKTCVQLAQRGLYFMGCVKTAHVEFPSKYLRQWASGSLLEQAGNSPERGQHILLQSTLVGCGDVGTHLYAMCWADKKAKCIVSTRGSTCEGPPSRRPRHRKFEKDGRWHTVAYEKVVKRPIMIEQFFRHFSTVDVHDHLRQGSIRMEKEWGTHCWWHRVFGTLFSMCVVDAYLAYRMDTNAREREPEDLNDFMGRLAYELVNNDMDRENSKGTTRGSVRDIDGTHYERNLEEAVCGSKSLISRNLITFVNCRRIRLNTNSCGTAIISPLSWKDRTNAPNCVAKFVGSSAPGFAKCVVM
jgi:hypothetical protein